MARQPRIDFPGAYHHVMNRGAAKQSTYRNAQDQELFLKLWERSVSRFGIEVISFALMGNHYHVFVRSPDGQLSDTMQYIGRAYTQTFNSLHDRDGALFRGRFHSVLVDSDQYFARVARYVELNPVAAGICTIEELATFRWSSFRYSSGAAKSPKWLSSSELKRRFGSSDEYRLFVESHVKDRDLERFYSRPIRQGAVLGDQTFVDRVAADHPNLAGALSAGLGRPTLEEIDAVVRDLTGAAQVDIALPSRPIQPARSVAILLAQSLTSEPRDVLALHYGFSSGDSFLSAANRAKSAAHTERIRGLHDAALAQLSPLRMSSRV